MNAPRAMNFTGLVAIVTGAGSRLKGEVGNGSATAVLLARHGANVAIVDRDIEAGEETKRMIESENAPGKAEVFQADVTKDGDCEAATAKVMERFGRVDILVNIVGTGGCGGNVDEVDLEAFTRDMHYNVTSMVQMARYAVPAMRLTGGGSIVNMSSVTGLIGGAPGVFYSTSKGAIVQMTRAMAGQHGDDNIRVNCVCPGFAYTPMARAGAGENGGPLNEKMREERRNQSYLKTEGTAWDIGNAILFLTSNEARWITGVILPVDGGYCAGRTDHPKMGHCAAGAAKRKCHRMEQ